MKMREYISLSLVRIDVDGFITQAPRILVHPYVSCLILLINTASIVGFVESGADCLKTKSS